MTVPRKPELPALTGLRFYAALLVILSHVTAIPGMDRLAGTRQVFNLGVVGVSLFFALSGFILAYNYSSFAGGVSASAYRLFVWDRWTKIYPVHVLTLLMMLPIQILSPNLPLDWRAVPFHLLLAQCWWPVTSPTFNQYLNVPSWSISCEWFFYLLAPLAIYCVLGGRYRMLLFTAAVAGYMTGLWVYLAHTPGDFGRLYLVSWFAPSRVPEFLTGVFLAKFYLRHPDGAFRRISGVAQVAGITMIAMGAIYRPSAPWPFWGGLLYLPGAALLILGVASGGGLLDGHLSRPWVRRLGGASFCLYLLQAPILRGARGVWTILHGEVQSWFGFWIVAVVMFLIAQTAAFLLHDHYEIVVEKALRRIVRERRRPAGYLGPAIPQGNL